MNAPVPLDAVVSKCSDVKAKIWLNSFARRHHLVDGIAVVPLRLLAALLRTHAGDAATATGGMQVFGLLLAALNQRLDADQVISILGDPAVESLDEVAQAFGVSPNTVKQSWRSGGMPGRPNAWPLAQILVWKEGHDRSVRLRRNPSTSAEQRQAEADARKTELQVEKLELELAETAGRLIDRKVAGTAYRTILAKLSEALGTIGDEMETEFPINVAKEKVATINRKLQLVLRAAAEEGARVGNDIADDGDQ